eukprot:jgi/Psemu1/33833/gm1.33833_g
MTASVSIRKRKIATTGRKRNTNATCCLGLVLHWFQTRGSVTRSVSIAFGLTSTVVYKCLKFSRKVILFVLQKHSKAMVTAPTEEEVEKYIATIGAKYPRLHELQVWGAAADGLKIKIQQSSSNWALESCFYNSWVCDTHANSVFDKAEELFFKYHVMVCVNSAFSVYTGRHHCLVQSLQIGDLDTPEALLFNQEATAVCRLSEWGMQMIQGQFLHLKAKLILEKFGDQKIIMNLVILLYNYQTSILGHNQILNVFMHQTEGYFSYVNKQTESIPETLSQAIGCCTST